MILHFLTGLGFFPPPDFRKEGEKVIAQPKASPKNQRKREQQDHCFTVSFLSNIKPIISVFLPEGRAGPSVLGAPGLDSLELKLKLFNSTFLREVFLRTI